MRDCRLIDSGDSKEGAKDSIFDIFEQRKGKPKKFDRSVEIKRKQLRILQLERSKNRKRVLTMEKEVDEAKDSGICSGFHFDLQMRKNRRLTSEISIFDSPIRRMNFGKNQRIS